MSLLQKTFIAAVIPVALLFVYIAPSRSKPTIHVNPLLTIAVEHELKMTLTMTVTRNMNERMIDIANDKLETVAISTPSDWHLSEVRGIPIADMKSTGPDAGYMRWQLPPNVSVTFRTASPFERLHIDNPSGELMNVRYTDVDLQKNTADHNAYLSKDNGVTVP